MTGSISLSNAAGDSATISLFGGQVLSWRSGDSDNLLYLSPRTPAAGKAVRGGIPVCFPQFANWGTLVKHGFVRTATWEQAGAVVSGAGRDRAHARLRIADSAATRAVWPHAFLLTLDVTLHAGALELALCAQNTGAAPFEFTAALHSYFFTPDVGQVCLGGLENTPYLDATDGNRPVDAALAPVRFPGEVDRIYTGAPAVMETTGNGAPGLRIAQQGFEDCVVWTPGREKTISLGDLPVDDWTRLFCVEAAQIVSPVVLEAGASWTGTQRITIA